MRPAIGAGWQLPVGRINSLSGNMHALAIYRLSDMKVASLHRP